MNINQTYSISSFYYIKCVLRDKTSDVEPKVLDVEL